MEDAKGTPTELMAHTSRSSSSRGSGSSSSSSTSNSKSSSNIIRYNLPFSNGSFPFAVLLWVSAIDIVKSAVEITRVDVFLGILLGK